MEGKKVPNGSHEIELRGGDPRGRGRSLSPGRATHSASERVSGRYPKWDGLWLSVVKMPIHKCLASTQHLVRGLSNMFPSLKWTSLEDRKSSFMTSAGFSKKNGMSMYFDYYHPRPGPLCF